MNDFKQLNQKLLSNASTLLRQWLPNGQVSNNSYLIGDIHGNKGKSLNIDLKTGMWFDFADHQNKGGDLISLYAKIKNISNYKAFKELGGDRNIITSKVMNHETTNIQDNDLAKTIVPFELEYNVNSLPSYNHWIHGKPNYIYYYKNYKKEILLIVVRHDFVKDFIPNKTITPIFFNGEKFVKKWPDFRPLYGLEKLQENPELPILLVEGEKAADNAREFITSHVVMTWPQGSNGIYKVDFSPIYNRSEILLWPDNDETGFKAMQNVAQILSVKSEANISILDFSEDEKFKDELVQGWDAYDAYKGDWTQETFNKFVEKYKKQFVKKINNPEVISGSYEISVPQNMVGELKEDIKLWEPLGLVLNQKQKPFVNELNIIKILNNWDKISRDFIWFDEFHQKLFTKGINGDEPKREWAEHDILSLLIKIQGELKIHQLNKHVLYDAVLNYVYDPNNKRNEAIDYLQSLTWDGVSRIDKFFIDYYGSEDNEYTRAIGKNLLIGITARLKNAGCKLDTMVVIEGAQGMKKSTSLKHLVSKDWYTETNISPDSKDFYMQLQGKAIVEIGELNSFGKAEITSIKQMLSCQSDRFRQPFGRVMQDYPRQCVFVGTTNDGTYLKDTTGNRRFWPVKATNIDIDKIIEDRDQLFAESYYRFKNGETWWEVPQALAEREQDTRLMALEDEWYEIVKDFVEGRSRVKIREIAHHKELNLEIKDINRIIQLRIASILKALGWETKVVKVKNDFGLIKAERFWMQKEMLFSDN